jgi:hypothetical protein
MASTTTDNFLGLDWLAKSHQGPRVSTGTVSELATILALTPGHILSIMCTELSHEEGRVSLFAIRYRGRVFNLREGDSDAQKCHCFVRKTSLRSCTEDLDQAVRDHLILAILQLPDSKAEVVRVDGMAMMAAVIVTGRRVRVASAHAAHTSTHAADSDWPGVGQFLHDLRPGDFELGGIDLPAVPWRHVPESLRIETAEGARSLRTFSLHR